MANFYQFKDKNSRKNFFKIIKEQSCFTWKEIIIKDKISRGLLDLYKTGTRINETNFNKLLSYTPYKGRDKIMESVFMVDSKDWLKKGGINAYKKNIKEFDRGREIGLVKIKKKISKQNKEMDEDLADLKITEDICEFIGAFIGDGFFNCYNNKLYQVEFAGDSRYDSRYYKNKIIPIVRSLVKNIKPHIYHVKDTNSIRIVFYSKELFTIIKKKFRFRPGKKTHTVKIPEVIMALNPKFINAAIRGIFNTDGGIFLDKRRIYKKPYPRIIFTTVSEPLYLQLRDYLKKDFKLHAGKNKNKGSYYIEIYGFTQLKKWMSQVGFSNPRHLDKVPL